MKSFVVLAQAVFPEKSSSFPSTNNLHNLPLVNKKKKKIHRIKREVSKRLAGFLIPLRRALAVCSPCRGEIYKG